MIDNNAIVEEELSSIESIDNCFPDIDYRVYLPIEEGTMPQQEVKLAPLYENREEQFIAAQIIKK